jgi:WD40 repeat protein
MHMSERDESTDQSSHTTEILARPESKIRVRPPAGIPKIDLPSTFCMFSGDKDGNLRQWILINNKFELLKNYDNIHKDRIFCLTVTRDYKYLFSGSCDKTVKQFDIKKKTLVRNWGKLHDNWVITMTTSFNRKYLFTGSADKTLKQWSINDKTLYKDFGQIHENHVYRIIVTTNDKWLFSISND